MKMSRGDIALVMFGILAVAGVLLVRSGLYGMTVFVLLPVFLGGYAVWIFRPQSGGQAALRGALSALVALLLFFLIGAEGAICIFMTAPIALPLGALGGWLAYRGRSVKQSSGSIAMLIFLPAASLTWDVKAPPPVFQVRTSIEIAAPPERVWRYVVAFPPLSEPQEWYFRAGLGYPTQTRIEGSGPGAARYCDFSTGSFVERVEVWDEPRLLRFQVTESAAPMREWSPYGEIVTKHLHGYFISREGQFQLTRLANNHTLVEGTSWYQHGLMPAEYWRWWSDAIIHRIHMRVLMHIKTLAEE
ncbi:MAG: SRPBCC family protein [Acidobacteriia bacterium]|nr:SRPBCC family protein [Terriglobia bacterium]